MIQGVNMIKLIQIIRYLKKEQKMNHNEIYAELIDIVDNGRSDYFQLSDNDIVSISDVFYDESRFESAFKVATEML